MRTVDQSTTVALSHNTYSHLLLMFPEKIQRYSVHQGCEWEAPKSLGSSHSLFSVGQEWQWELLHEWTSWTQWLWWDPRMSEAAWWGLVSRDAVDVLTITSSRGKAEIQGAWLTEVFSIVQLILMSLKLKWMGSFSWFTVLRFTVICHGPIHEPIMTRGWYIKWLNSLILDWKESRS